MAKDRRALTKEGLDALPAGSRVADRTGIQFRKIRSGDADWFTGQGEPLASKWLAYHDPEVAS